MQHGSTAALFTAAFNVMDVLICVCVFGCMSVSVPVSVPVSVSVPVPVPVSVRPQARCGHAESVSALVAAEGVDLGHCTTNGYSPLLFAAMGGHVSSPCAAATSKGGNTIRLHVFSRR